MAHEELIMDYDCLKYSIGFVCEDRSIIVTHISGIEEEFNNRTQFKKWLTDKNIVIPYTEFTIADKQTLKEDVSNCLHSLKHNIYKICRQLNVNNYRGFIGRGDSFRVGLSTLLKYKGQRTKSLKPLLISDIEEYLLKYHDAQIVTGIEADDKCSIECYKQPQRILVANDKDNRGINNINYYDTSAKELINTGSGLGRLELVGNKVKGYGRLFYYFQVLSGDNIDNYFANCFSDVKWADKSSYNALRNCKTDRECWQVIVDVYKHLYPKKKVVIGWRGDEIEIDWFYVLAECSQLAFIQRWENDKIDVKNVLDNLGVSY